MDRNIIVSVKTVLVLAGAVLAGYVIFMMGKIFAILGISLLIATAVEQSVKRLVKRRVRRGFAVYFVYILLILFGIGIFTVGIPPLIKEVRTLIANLPTIAQSLGGLEQFGFSVSDILPQVSKVTSNIISISYSVFSNVAVLITVFFLSLYMSLDWENIKARLLSLFSSKLRDEIEETIFEIEVSISQWIKGQAFLMLVVGLASFAGFSAIGVEYALALAVIAGLLEMVPMIGPVITAIIVTAITFTQSPVKGLMVMGLCIVIQQLENNLLVPRIMQKVSGFSPLVILIAVITFTNFFGIVGTVVAVPCVMVGYVIVKRILNHAGS
ncbi:MAG: AI-2E family transporter [Patescibacteria group bacterium]